MNKYLIITLIIAMIYHSAIKSVTNTDADSIVLKSHYVYSVLAHVGRLLPTWNFMREKYRTEGTDFGHFHDFSFQVLKQTIGEKPIEQIFHYPRYGMGLYTGQFFKDNYLSKPVGCYGIFMGTFTELNRLSLNYTLLFGITGNWNHYDPEHNNDNTTLASSYTTHIDFGILFNYEFSTHVEAGIGWSFAHFSNGALKIPNFGINLLAPQVSLSYMPYHTKYQRIRRPIPPYLKNTSLDIALYGGDKNLPYPECDLDTAHHFSGFLYPQFGLTAVVNRNISYVVALGVGLHLGYDSSKNARYREENGATKADLSFLADNINLGIIPSLELNFDKVAFVLQPCFSLFKRETTFKKPDFFGKFGLKFKLMDELYAGILLHTFKLHSDFIEFSLGYRLPLTRQSN